MDPQRFDTLARALHDACSRRFALTSAIGGTLTLLGLADSAAKKKNGKGKGKRKGRKKKGGTRSLLPGTCTPDCSGGRNCGGNGCGGSCGSCSGTDSCGGGGTPGVCGSRSACTPTCTGGRDCQANGTCTCPPEKPHSAPEQFCDETCRECCINSHCNVTKSCSHAQGSICVCDGFGHKDCGSGVCYQCCTEDDCYATHGWTGGNVICTADGNPAGAGLCRCDVGLAPCGGPPWYCANISTDSQNCGACGKSCNGGSCIGGQCQ